MIKLNSYEKLTVWHSLTFSGLTIAAIPLAATGIIESIGQQLILLAVLLPFSGIPHGALDYGIARETLEPKLGNLWSVMFLAVYLVMMSVVLLAWIFDPIGSLGAFLFITAFHFGFGDTLTSSRTPVFFRVADIVGRGGSVITYPALFFQDDVYILFSYLVPQSGAWAMVRFLNMMAPLVALAMLSSILWYIIRFFSAKDIKSFSRALELIAIALAFSLLPPMLAFTIYFTFLHSARHMLYVAGCTNPDEILYSIRYTIKRSIPVTLITIGLALAAYFLLAGTDLDLVRLTQVIFVGIASVTYPHMAVIALAQRKKVLTYQSALLSI